MKSDIITLLSGVKIGSQFATIHGYTSKETGEVSDFSIVFGASYLNALKKSEKILSHLTSFPESDKWKLSDMKLAHQELLSSVRESLSKGPGNNSGYTLQGYFEQVIPGVKYSQEKDSLYLEGLRIHKRVIVPGVYKKVNSSPKTLAKNELRKMLPTERFRTWKLTEDSFKSISIGNLEVGPEDLIEREEV